MQNTKIFWAHLQQISQEDILRIVDKLLACPTMSDRGSRETVLSLLDNHLVNMIRSDPRDDMHVTNIATTCSGHPGGLRNLVKIVEFYEKNSEPMKGLHILLEEISTPIVVSRELFEELKHLAPRIKMSRQELINFYLQSAPRDWLPPQGGDEAQMLALMLGKLVQARRWANDAFPIVKFVKQLATFAIAHEQGVGEELHAWVKKAAQDEGFREVPADVQNQDIPLQKAALERPPSLLVKFRPVSNEPNLVRIEACFLGEQNGFEKWVHVDERPRTLDTVPELLDQLTAHCNKYVKNPLHTLLVEIFLPITFLNYNMDQWMIDAGLNNMIPIGTYYPFIVRSLERIESSDTSGAQRMRHVWKQSWAALEQQADVLNPCFLHRQDGKRELLAELLNVICLAFTFVPPKVINGDPHVFSTMIGAGVPIALWPHYCDEHLDEHEIKNIYNSFLLGCDFSTLPIMIWKKRKRHDEHPLLQQLVLLWDNPNRLPHKDRRRIAAPQKKGSA